MTEHPEFINKNLQHCEGASAPCKNADAEWGDNGTMYQDERSNWSYLCSTCRQETGDYWAEMFDSYYSEILRDRE